MPEYGTDGDEVSLSGNSLFCGPPGAGLAQMYGIGVSEGVSAWLNEFRTYYTHLGRVAIRHACEIIGIGQSDDVIAPAYNCGSEIDPLLCSGASVKLYRIDRSSRIDLNDLEQRISKKTKVIYVTHYFGMPQRLEEVRSLCRDRKIYLIEDCALSLFSSELETKLGSLGDISIFSFPKTLPVPDGGAMVLNNPGLSVDSWVRKRPSIVGLRRKILSLAKRRLLYKSSESGHFYSTLWALLRKNRTNNDDRISEASFPDMPSNFYYDTKLNNSDISGITERMLRTFNPPEIISKRRRNFDLYLKLLSSEECVEPLYSELPDGVCPLYFPVFVPDREKVCRKLNALSIDATAWWSGYHRSLPWTEYPDACFLKDHLLVLPVHQDLDDKHIELICETLTYILHTMIKSRVRNCKPVRQESYVDTK